MIRLTLTLFLLFTAFLAYGQTVKKIKKNQNKEPEFSTAGEQEDYWTKRLFKFEYKSKNYKKFKGKITRIDSTTLQFDEIILKHEKDERLILMLEKGILFPWSSGLKITMWDELTELNPSVKVKRFRLTVYRSFVSNPVVYFIELTNENATSNLDIIEFIEGAKLTFLKEGWVMI